MSNKKYYISKFHCPSSVLPHPFILFLLSFNSEHFILFLYLTPGVAQILFFSSFVAYIYFYFISFYFFEIFVLSFNISFLVIFSQALFFFNVVFLLLSFRLS